MLLVRRRARPDWDILTTCGWLELVASPGMDPVQLGRVISQTYIQFYQVARNISEVTQSVVDESKVAAVASATNDLGAAILPHASTDAAALKSARDNSQAYPAGAPTEFDYRDLLDYAQKVNQGVSDPAITTAIVGCRRLSRTRCSTRLILGTMRRAATVLRSMFRVRYLHQPLRNAGLLDRLSELGGVAALAAAIALTIQGPAPVADELGGDRHRPPPAKLRRCLPDGDPVSSVEVLSQCNTRRNHNARREPTAACRHCPQLLPGPLGLFAVSYSMPEAL